MNDICMQAHYVTRRPDGGLAVSSPSLTVQLGDGTTVKVPLPYVSLGGELAVTPVVEADGESAIRIDLSRWTPTYVSPDLLAILPVRFPNQADAMRATREFDADPAISWRASEDDVVRWMKAWMATEQSTR